MDNFSEMYKGRLNDLIDQYSNHIISGGDIEDYEQYRHLCGVVKGLELCLREFKEILVRTEEDE